MSGGLALNKNTSLLIHKQANLSDGKMEHQDLKENIIVVLVQVMWLEEKSQMPT